MREFRFILTQAVSKLLLGSGPLLMWYLGPKLGLVTKAHRPIWRAR